MEHLLSILVFAQQINVRETATLVTGGGILDKLDEVSEKAISNLQEGKNLLFRRYKKFSRLGNNFDHRSGAVYFSPSQWRRLLGNADPRCSEILDYFSKEHVGYWQQDRPCFERILYTPTKVIMRGERYYIHMKNSAPTDRIRVMLDELSKISGSGKSLQQLRECASQEQLGPWKLGLAFLDQLRNITLQLLSFAHATTRTLTAAKKENGADSIAAETMEKVLETLQASYGDKEDRLHGAVRQAVRAYYSWLIGEIEPACTAFNRAIDAALAASNHLRTVCDRMDGWLAKDRNRLKSQAVSGLVRRWREADHPGENLLVCNFAAEKLPRKSSVTAVGIGWGGIELPIVFEFLGEKRGLKVSTYIASWSHYRNPSDSVRWVSFPSSEVTEPTFTQTNLLFDDNTLSGITLEKVRNDMLLRGAGDVLMYLIRYSGERRWHHMRMEDHGVIDPDFLLRRVSGYIGETAFSRSWSTKTGDYESHIGVFSLGRRRILECIHNNSTVEAWDREGF